MLLPNMIGALAILGFWYSRRHAKQLAAKREGISPASLIGLMVANGIAEPVAEFVWDDLGPYYGEGDILPHPDDGLTEDANINPEDVEDMVANFFRQFSLPEPTPQHPEFVPASMSISTLAHYLDERLRTFRNQIPPLAS